MLFTACVQQEQILGKRELSQQLANYYPNWEQFNSPDYGYGAPPETFYPNLPEQGNMYAWERFHHEYDHSIVPQQILSGWNLRDGARPATICPNLLAQGNTCALWEPNAEHVHSSLPQQSVDKVVTHSQ